MATGMGKGVPGCRLGFLMTNSVVTQVGNCVENAGPFVLLGKGLQVTGQVNTGDMGLQATAACCCTEDFKERRLK